MILTAITPISRIDHITFNSTVICCCFIAALFVLPVSAAAQADSTGPPYWNSSLFRTEASGMYSAGNVDRVLLRAGSLLSLQRAGTELDASAQYTYGEQNKQAAENDILAVASGSHTVYENLGVLAFGTTEASRLRRIDLRYQAGTGLKYTFVASAHHILKTSIVALFDYTRFADGRELESKRISLRLRGRHVLIPDRLILTHESFYQPSLIAPSEDYRWRTAVTLDAPLTTTIALNTTLQNWYESIVAPGRERNDMTFTIGIRAEWR